MKKSVERKDFKYNFLKKIIIRFDYNGILDLDLETTIVNLKDFLYDSGFISFKETYISEVDFDLRDPEKIETQLSIPVHELKKTDAFIFKNKEENKTIQITKFFTYMSIDSNEYVSFEEIGKTFSEIISIIIENNKFIRGLRLGLRKINNCILLDISKLNNYLEEKYFNNILEELYTDDIKADLMNSQSIDSFYIQERDVNLVRFLSQGVLIKDGKETDAYQVVLDIDVYSKNIEILDRVIENHAEIYDEIINMNNVLFKLYVQMLKDEFIKQLKTDGVDNNIILGVESNG